MGLRFSGSGFRGRRFSGLGLYGFRVSGFGVFLLVAWGVGSPGFQDWRVRVPLLGGPWDLVTTYTWAYNFPKWAYRGYSDYK